ncbi:MAG: hypothetical protein V1889_02695 [archaeon]
MEKKGLVGLIVLVVVLLVVGFFWFVGELGGETNEELRCEVDDDCVKVQVGCCACNMGGAEKCVARSFEGDYLSRLDNCSETMICAAVYNCEIVGCRCIDGECVGE